MLKPNASIAVIAPAGPLDTADLDRGLALLRDWGFKVVEGRHLRERHRYTAGTLAARSGDLNWALNDAQIDAVWLARGGFGCIHCLPLLPPDLPKDRIVIGCSDATALLVALAARGHGNLFHGPMVEGLVVRADDATRAWIRHRLMGSEPHRIDVTPLCGPQKEVAGPLMGGNLTVLASMAGTPFAMPPEPGIVVLEDVSEALYRLDRSVAQLRLSGALHHAQAILLGEFLRCPPPKDAAYSLEDVLLELFEPLGIPVFSTTEIGHGARNLAWKYGEVITLKDAAVHFSGPAAIPQ